MNPTLGIILVSVSVFVYAGEAVLSQKIFQSNINFSAVNLFMFECVWRVILMTICIPIFTQIKVSQSFDSSGYLLEFSATWKEMTSRANVYMLVISVGFFNCIALLSAVWVTKHTDATQRSLASLGRMFLVYVYFVSCKSTRDWHDKFTWGNFILLVILMLSIFWYLYLEKDNYNQSQEHLQQQPSINNFQSHEKTLLSFSLERPKRGNFDD